MNAVGPALLVAVASLLTAAGPADAAVFRRGYAPVYRPAPDPNHMPGWDWRRIYPYSPYNYGRNPYNPIILPYPPPYYYAYGYPPPYYGPDNTAAPDGAMFPSAIGHPVLMPHPSGALETPPPGAAIIQVRVPDESAHVLFDGERTYTIGTTRYFVTPELSDDKMHLYTISATWKMGDDTVTKERRIQVAAGHTTVVDFVHPAAE